MHRDVSTGNILLVGERAVLADLEYAKNFNPIPGTYAHDMRTVCRFNVELLLIGLVTKYVFTGDFRLYGS